MNNILESIDTSQHTPGQIIKAAREARQISLSEVAQRLLLSKQIIAAIEEDNYTKIPAKVYAEGYLKAYAQFLQIPIDGLLESFRRLNIYTDAEIKPETNAPVKNSGLNELLKGRRINFVLLIVLLILTLGLLMSLVIKSFVHKNTEATNISNAPSSVVNGGSSGFENEPVSVVTTDIADDIANTTSEKKIKNNVISTIMEKINSPSSLTLDVSPKETESKDSVKKE